jgi:hypothetical protein
MVFVEIFSTDHTVKLTIDKKQLTNGAEVI